ncbi:hypothetical protein D3C86_2058950 [compost metagenome]
MSATVIRPCFLARAAMPARSARRSIGLVGVSTQIILVCGVIAASMAERSPMSTKLKVRPAERLRTLSNSRNEPP